jgi:hypothetical protein
MSAPSEPQVFRPLANTTQSIVRWAFGNVGCINTFYWRWSGNIVPTQGELQTLNASVLASLVDRMRECQVTQVRYQTIISRNMESQNGLSVETQASAGQVGTRPSGAVAGNEAARIFRKSALAGRSKKGAISVSGFGEGDVDGNSLSSQLMALLARVALEMLITRVSSRFIPATASFKLGTSSILASTGQRDSNIDSQKTRLNGRGT